MRRTVEQFYKQLTKLTRDSAWLGRLSARFEAQNARHTGDVLSRRRSPGKLVVAIVCAVIPVWFIGIEIKHIVAPTNDLYTSQDFYNLTKAGVEWDVYYGKSRSCGELDCYLTSDLPASEFTKKMVLPAREFPLIGYKEGDLIYLRSTVTIPESVRNQHIPIAFHSLYIWAEHYEFYVNGVMLDEGKAETLNVTLPSSMIPKSGELQLAFKIDPGKLPYQGIAHRKDLLIGAKDALKRTAWRSVELSTTYWLWFLIPKMTFCFIFAILYIFLAQNRELFSFICYIFLSSFSIFIESSYADVVKGWGIDSAIAAPLSLCFSDLFLILFIRDFYRRQGGYFFKGFRATLVGVGVLSAVMITALPAKTTVNALLSLELLIRGYGAFYGIYLSALTGLYLHRTGKSPSRKIIAFILFIVLGASLVPVSLEAMRVYGDILNMNFGGFPYMQAFDLVLFGVLASITAYEFGMTATLKQAIEKDLRIMEERLELGRSVQNLLLPPEKEGETPGASYQFFFESAQTMAGDWYYIWEPQPGEVRLFIGDVTGKGPQAALAVAAIISGLSGCREENLSVEDTITTLNRRIFGLFKGKVLTVMNVTVIHNGKRADLYNCGSVGWVIGHGQAYKFVAAPGSQIGSSPDIKVVMKSVELNEGDVVMTFTDGVIEGARPLKRLVTGMSEASQLKSGSDFFNFAVAAGSEFVHPDDRTMLFVRAS